MLADQQELTSVRTQEDLPGVMDDRDEWRERESGKSMQAVRHDDDDDIHNVKFKEQSEKNTEYV